MAQESDPRHHTALEFIYFSVMFYSLPLGQAMSLSLYKLYLATNSDSNSIYTSWTVRAFTGL